MRTGQYVKARFLSLLVVAHGLGDVQPGHHDPALFVIQKREDELLIGVIGALAALLRGEENAVGVLCLQLPAHAVKRQILPCLFTLRGIDDAVNEAAQHLGIVIGCRRHPVHPARIADRVTAVGAVDGDHVVDRPLHGQTDRFIVDRAVQIPTKQQQAIRPDTLETDAVPFQPSVPQPEIRLLIDAVVRRIQPTVQKPFVQATVLGRLGNDQIVTPRKLFFQLRHGERAARQLRRDPVAVHGHLPPVAPVFPNHVILLFQRFQKQILLCHRLHVPKKISVCRFACAFSR